ncbi:MAG: membrane protein insertase YidC [Alphaproteobacteria bacterium]|nr:membrane protein insertase YidC [Alphaproteobacteria bacterium]
MMKDPNKNLHPQDMRNLFIFFVLSTVLYIGYSVLFVQPQSAAIRQAQTVRQLEATKPVEEKPARTREEILTDSPRLHFENNEVFGSIALRGARLDDLSFHHHFEKADRKDPVVLLSPVGSDFARYVDLGWVPGADTKIAVPDSKTLWRVVGNDKLAVDQPVTLSWDNGQGLTFKRTLQIDDNYLITVTDSIHNQTGKALTLYPYGLVAQQGLPPHLENQWVVHEGTIGFIGNKLEEAKYKEIRDKGQQSYSANQGWLGITDKYWLTALLPPQGSETQFRYSHVGTSPHSKKEKESGLYQADYTGAGLSIAPGGKTDYTAHVFAGVKKVVLLKNYERALGVPKFDLAVDFGWFWFFSKPFFYALHYLGLWIGNFGVAIITMTIIIRSSVFPLTNASYRSFAKMKKVTPQIVALREAYGSDKKRLQEEMMQLYQREGVNPMAGCVPVFLQIPIFFALYKVLVVTIEMRHAPFFGWIQDLSAPDPTSIFNLFGLIPWDPPSFLDIGVWPCLMLVMMLIQKKLNPPPQDPIQRDLNNYFPFIITYTMAHFAAGLVIYWTFSAFITILQQIIIMRSLNVPIYLFGQSPAEKKLDESVDKGPAVHPLVDMAEEKAEEALFGTEDTDESAAPKKPISPPRKGRKKRK